MNIKPHIINSPNFVIDTSENYKYHDSRTNVIVKVTEDIEEEQEIRDKIIESDFEEIEVATMRLNIIRISGFDQESFEIADENGDLLQAYYTSEAYFKKYKYKRDFCKYINRSDPLFGNFHIVELHTLFINPEWRGKGISKKLFMSIPSILDCTLNINDAFIAAEVNPYISDEATCKDGIPYMKQNDIYDGEMFDLCRKSIKKAGYVCVRDKDFFCTDTWTQRVFNKSHDFTEYEDMDEI